MSQVKKVKFEEKLIQPILIGKKIQTWRVFDDKNLSKGDKIDLTSSSTGEVFGRALITDIDIKRGQDISKDKLEAYGYKDKEDMIENLNKYYGNKVDQNTIVKIINFKLLNHNN